MIEIQFSTHCVTNSNKLYLVSNALHALHIMNHITPTAAGAQAQRLQISSRSRRQSWTPRTQYARYIHSNAGQIVDRSMSLIQHRISNAAAQSPFYSIIDCRLYV